VAAKVVGKNKRWPNRPSLLAIAYLPYSGYGFMRSAHLIKQTQISGINQIVGGATMRTKVHFIASLLFAFVTLSAKAQDPVKVASQAFKEKLNNAKVRVLEYHSKPGDKEARHSHSAAVIYVISGGKFKFTTPDGRSEEVEYRTGDVVWREAVAHSGENIGTTEIHAILVEMKEPTTIKTVTLDMNGPHDQTVPLSFRIMWNSGPSEKAFQIYKNDTLLQSYNRRIKQGGMIQLKPEVRGKCVIKTWWDDGTERREELKVNIE